MERNYNSREIRENREGGANKRSRDNGFSRRRNEHSDRTDRGSDRRENNQSSEGRERRNYSGERSVSRTNRIERNNNERVYNRDRQENEGNRFSRDNKRVRSNSGERSERFTGNDRNTEGNRQERGFRRDYNRDNTNADRNSERKIYRRASEKNDEQEGRRNVYPKTDRPRREGTYERKASGYRREIDDTAKEELRQKHYSKKKQLAHRLKTVNDETELRLNRYISMGGVCSRRDADALITSGRVKVNGEVVLTVGIKVKKKDQVEVDNVMIVPERKVYLVLNKPKDYVTTVEDPLERKTVMSLIETACKERVYPVGRLDRQTTGVLLFTNDGDLAKKLTHPKYDHKKIYHVFLDKPLALADMDAIRAGLDLEDGFIKADDISYASADQTQVGVEIHSGRNRIVRRIFEHFGYQIEKLDRVYFAGITKKNLPRGRWRMLTSEEINVLKIY